jgi:FSR family fosmidomycin resistance protein-like MFS transporter
MRATTESEPTAVGQPAEVSGRRRATLGLGALAFGHLAVDCCTGIFPVYKTLAHLDLHFAGVVATVAGVLSNALQLGFGALADRGHSRALLVLGTLGAGAVVFAPFVEQSGLTFALVLATSIGSAAFHPVAAGATGELSQKRAGLLLALFLSGGYVGYSLSQLAFTALFRRSVTWALFIVPALAALALLRFGDIRRHSADAAPPQPLQSAWRSLVPLFAVQALAATVNVSLVFLLPDLLLELHAPAWAAEGGGHFALVAGGALALLPAGHAADRFGARGVLGAALVLAGLCLSLVLGAHLAPMTLMLTLTAFGAFISASNVVAVSSGNRLAPGRGAGVSALLMGLPWALAALGPLVAGTLADPRSSGTPSSALAWVGACLPLAFAAALTVPRLSSHLGPAASGGALEAPSVSPRA